MAVIATDRGDQMVVESVTLRFTVRVLGWSSLVLFSGVVIMLALAAERFNDNDS